MCLIYSYTIFTCYSGLQTAAIGVNIAQSYCGDLETAIIGHKFFLFFSKVKGYSGNFKTTVIGIHYEEAYSNIFKTAVIGIRYEEACCSSFKTAVIDVWYEKA